MNQGAGSRLISREPRPHNEMAGHFPAFMFEVPTDVVFKRKETIEGVGLKVMRSLETDGMPHDAAVEKAHQVMASLDKGATLAQALTAMSAAAWSKEAEAAQANIPTENPPAMDTTAAPRKNQEPVLSSHSSFRSSSTRPSNGGSRSDWRHGTSPCPNERSHTIERSSGSTCGNGRSGRSRSFWMHRLDG